MVDVPGRSPSKYWLVRAWSQVSRSGPVIGDDVAVREVDEPLARGQRPLLAQVGAVVRGNPGVQAVRLDGRRKIQERAARQ